MLPLNSKVCVALSGGKDSMLMLYALKQLSRFHPKNFSVFALFIDLGFKNIDISAMKGFCKKIDVELIIKKTDIATIVFDIRNEKNPCSLCAKMRRGVLHDCTLENGSRTIALGHHSDDAVETFIMNLYFESRIGCFKPKTYLSRKDIHSIRPMIYLSESEIIAATERLNIPIIKSPCPMDNSSKRAETKNALLEIEEKYPGFKNKALNAILKSFDKIDN